MQDRIQCVLCKVAIPINKPPDSIFFLGRSAFCPSFPLSNAGAREVQGIPHTSRVFNQSGMCPSVNLILEAL